MPRSSNARANAPVAPSRPFATVLLLAVTTMGGCGGPGWILDEQRADWFSIDELNAGGAAVVVTSDDQSQALSHQIEYFAGRGVIEALAHNATTPSWDVQALADETGVADAVRATAERFHIHTTYDGAALADAAPVLRNVTARRYLVIISVRNADTYSGYWRDVRHETERTEVRDRRDDHDDDDDDKKKKKKEHRSTRIIETPKTVVTHTWGAGVTGRVGLLVIRLDDGEAAWRIFANAHSGKSHRETETYYGEHRTLGPPAESRLDPELIPPTPRPAHAIFGTVNAMMNHLARSPATR